MPREEALLDERGEVARAGGLKGCGGRGRPSGRSALFPGRGP